MTTPAMRVCPIADCCALIELATDEELEAGYHLWQCANGHHGPAVIDFHGYTAP